MQGSKASKAKRPAESGGGGSSKATPPGKKPKRELTILVVIITMKSAWVIMISLSTATL